LNRGRVAADDDGQLETPERPPSNIDPHLEEEPDMCTSDLELSLQRRLSRKLRAVAALSVALFATVGFAPIARADVTTSPDGWTEITRSADTLVVYVSSSLGDDNNDGLSEQTPKRTIDAGKRLLRHGQPDWLLLRRGDTWRESLGWWVTSGRSTAEPQLVGAWGAELARPLLLTGDTDGIQTFGGFGSPDTIDHVALIGLHFVADSYDGGERRPVGVRLHQPSTNLLVEDCKIERYFTNVLFEAVGGRHADLALRRSVIVDAFTTTLSHSQGIYVFAVDGLLLEENLFDHNGWSERDPGAIRTMFRHQAYIQTGNTGAVVVGNIFANASSHGAQMRSGGLAEDNLFVRCSLSLLMRGGQEPVPQRARALRNVVLDGQNINESLPRGHGISFRDVSGEIVGNVIANNTRGLSPVPIEVVADVAPVGDAHIEGNVVSNWSGSVFLLGGVQRLRAIMLKDNVLQNEITPDPLLHCRRRGSFTQLTSEGNRFHSTIAPAHLWMRSIMSFQSLPEWLLAAGDTTSTDTRTVFANPNASVGSYHGWIGGRPRTSAFLEAAREQSRATWRQELTAGAVNAYVRGSFGLAP
jgi:hypothetical protein